MISTPITRADVSAGLDRMMRPTVGAQRVAVGDLPADSAALVATVLDGQWDDRLGALRALLAGAGAPYGAPAAVAAVDARARVIAARPVP